jgi:cardiolipin synthase
MRWTLPNILTVIRLIAAPWVALVFVVAPRPVADWVALLLFIGASVTDYVDGYLARAWKQVSAFGTMLDPIADKAVVVIAIATLVGLFGLDGWILVPATVILLREVFVSGLREYLGARAGLLKVTNLAKYKTFTQMVAVAVLFAQGLFEHYFGMLSFGMGREMAAEVLSGQAPDEVGLVWKFRGMVWSYHAGVVLLWLAAALTAITGWDYFRKARPFLVEEQEAK